ncbi:hypothetical protein HPLT_08389 (plasmid) [Helicobacter pylori Lithuania75]|nr:hypothetical protein HPLT_08389 [Helicobacter pylori Lithuania75]
MGYFVFSWKLEFKNSKKNFISLLVANYLANPTNLASKSTCVLCYQSHPYKTA